MAVKVKHSPESTVRKDLPLIVKNLSVTRNSAPILKDISFNLNHGEILGISGVNGSGKTTLVSTLAGIEIPRKNIDYEEVSHEGVDVIELTPQQRFERGIHFVFEGRKLFGNMTVRENLEVAMSYDERKNSDKRIKEILELFPKMEELLEKNASKCSGGQQQIIAIARAVMQYPNVLVLDEPTLGLSPTSIAAVTHALKLLASGSVSIIVLEQRTSFINEIADRKLSIENGKVVAPINQALRTKEWKPEVAKVQRTDILEIERDINWSPDE